METRAGRIIILNGTSSSGKTTLAAALRIKLEPQFHYYASDQLAAESFRPLDAATRSKWRDTFFDGFHRSIPAFASAGIDLLVEHIVEEESWIRDLNDLLKPFDVFWIGVHAPPVEIERRERLRADRHIGEGSFHLKTHSYCSYDVQVDTTEPLDRNVETILRAWKARRSPQRSDMKL